MRAGDEAFEALQRAIEALADAEAAELVAEARVEARAKVRTILAEAMAQALLDRSQAELSSPLGETSRAGSTRRSPRRAERSAPRAEPEPVQPERPAAGEAVPADEGVTGSADELGWYVYGVVGDTALDLPQSLSGVDEGHQVRLLREGDLAAIASQVPLTEFGEETLHESVNDVEWLERMARPRAGPR